MIDKGEVTPWYILLNSGASCCSRQPSLTSLSFCAIISSLRVCFDDRLRRTPRPGNDHELSTDRRNTVLRHQLSQYSDAELEAEAKQPAGDGA